MGADDDRDCVEHVWVMAGMTLDLDGSHIDYHCERCGAVMVEGPAELRGEWDRQDAAASRSDTDAGA